MRIGIHLQIPTKFCIYEKLDVHRLCDVRQIEIHTAEPLVPHRLKNEFKRLIRLILCSELIIN
jgi:hypothetical protein